MSIIKSKEVRSAQPKTTIEDESWIITLFHGTAGFFKMSISNLLNYLGTKFPMLVDGVIPSQYIPYVQKEVIFVSVLPTTGISETLYVMTTDNTVHSWDSSTAMFYNITSNSLYLGETSTTAYRGDRGKAAYDLTKRVSLTSQLVLDSLYDGIGVSDSNGTELYAKTGALIQVVTAIKTDMNNTYQTAICSNSTIYNRQYSKSRLTWSDWKNVDKSSFITKSSIGLSNVDNTSDLAKPISTEQGLVNTSLQTQIDNLETSDLTSQEVKFCTVEPLPSYSYSNGLITMNNAGLLVFGTIAAEFNELVLVKNENADPLWNYNGVYRIANNGGSEDRARLELVSTPDFVLVSSTMTDTELSDDGEVYSNSGLYASINGYDGQVRYIQIQTDRLVDNEGHTLFYSHYGSSRWYDINGISRIYMDRQVLVLKAGNGKPFYEGGTGYARFYGSDEVDLILDNVNGLSLCNTLDKTKRAFINVPDTIPTDTVIIINTPTTSGTMAVIGDATTWEDDNLDPTTLTGGGTAPASINFGDSTIKIASFVNGASDEVAGSRELPHKWKIGSPITFHAHVHPTNTNPGVLRIGLEYSFVCEGTVPTTPTIIYAEVAMSGTQWQMKTINFAEITPPSNLGCQFHFRFFRDGSHANDTFTGDAAISTIGYHYEADSLGSRLITTK